MQRVANSEIVLSFFTFLILYNNLVPISLYVSLDMIKVRVVGDVTRECGHGSYVGRRLGRGCTANEHVVMPSVCCQVTQAKRMEKDEMMLYVTDTGERKFAKVGVPLRLASYPGCAFDGSWAAFYCLLSMFDACMCALALYILCTCVFCVSLCVCVFGRRVSTTCV